METRAGLAGNGGDTETAEAEATGSGARSGERSGSTPAAGALTLGVASTADAVAIGSGAGSSRCDRTQKPKPTSDASPTTIGQRGTVPGVRSARVETAAVVDSSEARGA